MVYIRNIVGVKKGLIGYKTSGADNLYNDYTNHKILSNRIFVLYTQRIKIIVTL